ncbi:MAG: NADH:flavin oxidoreductase/NADH oxidase [bacterium]
MSILFTPFSLRGLTLRNRVMMPPMAQYLSTEDGKVNDWHFVHYGTRAVGGVGLIMIEVTAVEPGGRLTPHDLGLWDEEQVLPLAKLVDFLKKQGAAVGVQIGHAGRKAWGEEKGHGHGGLLSSSPLPFEEGWAIPQEMSNQDCAAIVHAFRQAAIRARTAGVDTVEIHAAHGYLLHQFLSPLVNCRTDCYGGNLENRMRLLREVASSVRSVWPANRPVLARLSCTDWAEGGLTIQESVAVAQMLKTENLDLIDCSSGGAVAWALPKAVPGYQVPFAATIRREAKIPTAAVGLIIDPLQAESILTQGQADLVDLGRELLRNPYWVLQAAAILGEDIPWPTAYQRAKPVKST